MGKVQVQPDYPRGITFEQVWAGLMENREQLKETDRIVKENAKLIGGLGDRYGEMIEYMVKPNLVKKFRELGFEFTKIHHSTEIKDEKKHTRAG